MLTQIGRFLVQSEVGRGGFGRVYRALDPAVGRLVAVKVLTEGSKDLLTRFRNEASVAANLRHDNIVTIYEYGEHEGNPFLAMEVSCPSSRISASMHTTVRHAMWEGISTISNN